MTRALHLLCCVALALAGACVHDVSITSTPPGADVYVEGERVGRTPLVWQETGGHADRVTVSVRRGATEARFALVREQVLPVVAVTALAAGVVAFLGGMGFATAGYVLFLVGGLAATGAPVALAVAAVGLVTALAGILLGTIGARGPFVIVGELGRASPDEVHVDFAAGTVEASTPGVEDLVGTTPGYAPLTPRSP